MTKKVDGNFIKNRNIFENWENFSIFDWKNVNFFHPGPQPPQTSKRIDAAVRNSQTYRFVARSKFEGAKSNLEPLNTLVVKLYPKQINSTSHEMQNNCTFFRRTSLCHFELSTS